MVRPIRLAESIPGYGSVNPFFYVLIYLAIDCIAEAVGLVPSQKLYQFCSNMVKTFPLMPGASLHCALLILIYQKALGFYLASL